MIADRPSGPLEMGATPSPAFGTNTDAVAAILREVETVDAAAGRAYRSRQMSLDDWTTRFDDFMDRVNNQDAYRRTQEAMIADRLMTQDPTLTRTQALEQAASQLTRQDPLHGPDRRAGGNPEHLTGFGDRGVNRSIDSQWRGRATDMQLGVRDALRHAGIDPAFWGDLRLNVRLRLDDTLATRA